MSKLKLGLIGLGTVGCGVYKTVEELDNVEIVKVAVKNMVILQKKSWRKYYFLTKYI